MSITEIGKMVTPQVAIDFIALRDIEAGEELFLDYGDDWEDAWTKHVERWKQNSRFLDASDSSYKNSTKFNLDHYEEPIRTEKEQKTDPYPANLELRCHDKTVHFNGRTSSKVEWQAHSNGRECNVIERELQDSNFKYTVSIHDEDGEIRLIREVMRDFLAFFDRSYSTDMHLRWVFRQKIMFPDAIFPQQWRNLH
jgi:hypothetical protein